MENPPEVSGDGNVCRVVPDTVDSAAAPSPVPIPYPNIGPAGNAKKLPPTIKHELEAKFGADLSDVSVYTNHAPTLLNAKAFTSGNKIFFAPTMMNVFAEGKNIISHEIAHVVQQRGGVTNKNVREALENGGPATGGE